MNLMNEYTGTDLDSKRPLSSLAPNSISNFNPSDTFAIVSLIVGARAPTESRRVDIPDQLKSCPIMRCFIQFFNSSKFKSNSLIYAYGKVLRFNIFANWAILTYPDDSVLPVVFIQDFVRWLRIEKKLKLNSICQETSFYRTALEWFLEEFHADTIQIDTLTKIREALTFIPSVPSRAGRNTQSLGQITDQPEKDELKILRSTIRFCCNFLKQMNDHRIELLSYPEVKQQLDKIISECDGDFEQLRYSTTKSNRSKLYKPLANAILKSNSLQLKERLLHNQPCFRNAQLKTNHASSTTEANNLIHAGLRKSGALNIYPENPDHKLYFHNIDFLFLVKHTPCEELAFAWLLATDRIQLSGILHMRQGDLRITPSLASPIYIKGRSKQKIREVPMHPKKSMQYQSYCEFDALKKSFQELFPSVGDMLIHLPTVNIQCVESATLRPLMMAAQQQTAQYKSLFEADREVELFADITRRVDLNNRPIWSNIKTRRDNVALGNIGVNPTPVKLQTINVTSIAQSRAILDVDGSDPSNEAFEKYSQEIVGADATAHSPGVKQVVYINASETKYRLDKRASFASSVGHLMVEDARKIQAAVSQETLLSITDFKIMLGWHEENSDAGELEEFDKIFLSAQKAGFTILPFGQLEKDNRTFIITNSITAALLISYRDECISQLSLLSTEDESKAFAIAMQAAYIESALEKFDQKTIAQGRDTLKKHTFPKPIIR